MAANKRGISSLVGFALIISVLIFTVVVAIIWRTVASENVSDLINRYTLSIKDKEVQLLKSGFEKSAIFYSLMSSAKELGLHGGLSEEALSSGSAYVSGVSPPLRFEECALAALGAMCPPPVGLTGERIPYWLVPSSESCGSTKQRVPYLRLTDMGQNIGQFPTATAGEARSEVSIVWNTGNRYGQYFEEVNASKYSLYVVLQIFFIKNGKVKVQCGDGCGALSLMPETPAEITTDGTYEYEITAVNLPVGLLKLNLTATDDLGLDGRNVARLKQTVVSIYDNNIDKSGNTLFTENLAPFNANMKASFDAKNPDSATKIQINPLLGALYRGDGGTLAGIAWSPQGIVSNTEDYLGNGELVDLRSSGVTEEEAKIRYWIMYDYADKFAQQAEGVLKRRLWAALNTLPDTSVPTVTECRYGCKDQCSFCKSDEVSSYLENDIYRTIDSELRSVSANYSSLSASGITWSMAVPSGLFKACPLATNPNTAPCSSTDSCDSQNFEHYEYRRGNMYSGGCCQCSGSTELCSNGGVSTDNAGYCSGAKSATCDMEYFHRYVLKNLKVLVTITDASHKVFDASTGEWVPLQFRFFVLVPLVDDNCCTGSLWTCSDYRASMCAEPAKVEPSL